MASRRCLKDASGLPISDARQGNHHFGRFQLLFVSAEGVWVKTDQFSPLEVERAVVWPSPRPVIAKNA
jgi:hypothetical protein